MRRQNFAILLSRVELCLLGLLFLDFPSHLSAQQAGNTSAPAESWPPLKLTSCNKMGCRNIKTHLTMDAEHRQIIDVNGTKSCFSNGTWNQAVCSDPKSCSKNCALGKVNYTDTQTITTQGHSVTIKLSDKDKKDGRRLYLMDSKEFYKLFQLKNQEISFDVDVSNAPPGVNAALYFVGMEADGGKSKYNQAGAPYGTGYCSSNCPTNLKFVNGKANIKPPTPPAALNGTGVNSTAAHPPSNTTAAHPPSNVTAAAPKPASNSTAQGASSQSHGNDTASSSAGATPGKGGNSTAAAAHPAPAPAPAANSTAAASHPAANSTATSTPAPEAEGVNATSAATAPAPVAAAHARRSLAAPAPAPVSADAAAAHPKAEGAPATNATAGSPATAQAPAGNTTAPSAQGSHPPAAAGNSITSPAATNSTTKAVSSNSTAAPTAAHPANSTAAAARPANATAANLVTEKPKSNLGSMGSCCPEVDVWQANKVSQTFSAHPCIYPKPVTCHGSSCKPDALCASSSSCDFSSFRATDRNFYGPSKTVNTLKQFRVITQFITDDGTSSGDLVEIRRLYVQNGKVIENARILVPRQASFDSVTDGFCSNSTAAIKQKNSFKSKGGLESLGKAMDNGMVMVLSISKSDVTDPLWLSAKGPLKNATEASTHTVQASTNVSDASVTFSHIRIGPLNSSLKI